MRHLRSSGPTVTLAAVLAALGGIGCGGNSGDLKKQVRALETQVTALRADADRLEERLQALELGTAASARASRPADGTQERPRLKTIHLAPEDGTAPEAAPAAPAAPATEPEAPRPVIRGTGDKVIKTGDGSPTGRVSPPLGSDAALRLATRVEER